MIGTSLDPVSFLAGFITCLALAITLASVIAALFAYSDKRGLSKRRHRPESQWAELSGHLFPTAPAVAPNRDSAAARTTAASESSPVLSSLPRRKRHRPESK